MVPRAGAVRSPDYTTEGVAPAEPTREAVEFVLFCYRRRRLGWPELYDEMCAVAGRGLFRGMSAEELAEHGIGLGLFDLPALSSLAARILAEQSDRPALRPAIAAAPA